MGFITALQQTAIFTLPWLPISSTQVAGPVDCGAKTKRATTASLAFILFLPLSGGFSLMLAAFRIVRVSS